MRFKGLDLNLLVALDALLESRSIARTAERLNLSQPAASAALGRLRAYFEDDLLILDGKKFHLSAAARTLVPLVRQCLIDAEILTTATRRFDPLTSQRIFRFVASDYTSTLLLANFSVYLAKHARGLKLDIVSPELTSVSRITDGEMDFVIGPEAFVLTDHPFDVLFNDRYVFVGWDQNPIFQAGITMDDVRYAGHVVTTFGPERVPSYGDRQLEAIIAHRRIDVSCSFGSLPWFLPETMRLALTHEKLARFYARLAPLAYAPPPFEMPPTRIVLQYHRSREDDAGISWVRQTLGSLAQMPEHSPLPPSKT